MAARAGTLGSSPLFRGTTGPSQILKTPRGFQAMQEILKSEAAYFATPVGVAYLVNKYGIPEGTIQEMISQVLDPPQPVTENTDLSGIILETKKDDKEVKKTIDQEGNEIPPLPDLPPEDPEEDPDETSIIIESAEQIAQRLAREGTDELIDKGVNKLKDKYKEIEEKKKFSLTQGDPQKEDTSVEVPSNDEERAIFFKENVGDIQRGDAEEAMVAAQHYMGGGVLSHAIEHIGDLTHRITENPGFRYETVLKKVNAMINSLDRGEDWIPFAEEVQRNIVVNSKYSNLSPDEFKTQINMLLQDYIAEHEKIPTFNDLQEHSKQAAIAIGNQDYKKTLKHLYALKKELDKGSEHFVKMSQEVFGEPYNDPKNFLAKDKNTKFYIEALVPDKINGEVDLREIDYLNKKAPPIDFTFDVKTLNDVKTNTLKEINNNTNVDVMEMAKKHGFKMPDLDLINKSLKGGADERYWYQKGSQWMNNFLQDFSPEEQNDFYDILSITSGGLDPYQNLKVAIGVFSDHLNNRPIRIGFRQAASLNKFLQNPDVSINSPKFGNYVDTFKYFNKISDRVPNTVIDLQMAAIFGIDPQVLAANPELYALVTKSLGNLTKEVNEDGWVGQELQPIELQSLLWSEYRGGSTNYAQMGEKLIQDLQNDGFVFEDNILRREELADPNFVEKIQTTVKPYTDSMKATIEVGTYLSPNGKKIEQLINNFSDDTVLMNQINQVHKSNLTKLISKKDKKPSVMENLISFVIGKKAEVSRMMIGTGTYEGKANFNVIVPLTVKTKVLQPDGKYKEESVALNENERKYILSILGENLNQDAMAASNFNILQNKEGGVHGEKDKNPKATPTIQLYIQSSYTQEDVQKLHQLTGLDFNITPVPGGFMASALTENKNLPNEKEIQVNFEKVFGKDKKMVYIPSEWYGDYIKSKKYKENINEFQKSNAERMESDGTSSFNIDYFTSLVSTLQGVNSSVNKTYGEILDSKKVINKLTKNNITLKRKGGFIEIPTFHFGGFIDVNRL